MRLCHYCRRLDTLLQGGALLGAYEMAAHLVCEKISLLAHRFSNPFLMVHQLRSLTRTKGTIGIHVHMMVKPGTSKVFL